MKFVCTAASNTSFGSLNVSHPLKAEKKEKKDINSNTRGEHFMNLETEPETKTMKIKSVAESRVGAEGRGGMGE